MKYRKLIFLFVFFFLASLFFAQQPPPISILMLTHKDEGFTNGFWNALRIGGETAAKKADVRFTYSGVPLQFQTNRPLGQDTVIKDAIKKGITGIVITPSDSYRLASSVAEAVLNDVLVVSIDSAIESNMLSGVVATNNYAGGLLAAEHMVALCKGTGDIVMLVHPSRANKATLDREQAFIAGIARFGPKMNIVSADRFGGATIESDYKVAMELLKQYPNLKGLYSVSGSGFIGTLRALKDSKKNTKVFLIGWDADTEILVGLRDGSVHGVMQQDPEQMGAKGVELLLAALQGSKEKKYIEITPALITNQNLQTANIQRLLAPLVEN